MSVVGFYAPRSIKKRRQTKAEKDRIREAICSILKDAHPQTIRQIFSALTVEGVIAKTEAEYKAVLQFPKSNVYNYALYKMGWVYFNLGQFNDAKSKRTSDKALSQPSQRLNIVRLLQHRPSDRPLFRKADQH